MGKVYAIDFDGVICEDNYPNIGKPNKAVIDKMEKLHKEGHTIIIWTCRCDDKLEKAKVWLKDYYKHRKDYDPEEIIIDID